MLKDVEGAMKIKKWIVVLSFIMIVIFISSKGFASNKEIDIIMDGKKYKVIEVPVVIDGQFIYSDIPTFIHNGYTFVPIRFIAEYYGARVNWEQKTKTVIVTQKDKEIKMTIDSKDVYINNNKKVLNKGMVPKFVTFSNNDSRTMVPLRFISETLGYEVGWNDKNSFPFINTLNNNYIKENMDIVEIINIEVEIKSNNEPNIIINGTKKFKYSTMLLENPSRLVIDIDDAKLNIKNDMIFDGGVGNIDVNSDLVNKVTFSQFSNKPNIVRVVVHLWDKVDFDIVYIDEGKSLGVYLENKKAIFPEKNFEEKTNYFSVDSNRIINIDAKKETNYNVEYDRNDKIMTITLPSRNVDLKEGFTNIKDGLINDILVENIGEETKVTITFRISVQHTILSKNKDNKISISLKKNENIRPEDRLVVVDPGHGGKDPGAISSNGTKEKDVVLAISQKLNKGLKAKGYNTLMIRDGDFFIDKYERAKIANINEADMFISIHANAFKENPEVSGIEILYCPTNSNNTDQRNNYELAKIISEELINSLGAKDRGLVKAPNTVVIRDTKMPAILIETGFLTNPEEEELIQDEDYQNKMVEAIIIGIEKYFDIY